MIEVSRTMHRENERIKMVERTFCEIGCETGTDKCKGHRYHVPYGIHFEPLRAMPLLLLEIGVQHGASMKLWEEFFPRARIFGVDRDPSCKRFENARTTILIGDQEDPEFLKKVSKAPDPRQHFDIIIDDGGHGMGQQRTSFLTLFPSLARRGLYVIEDLQ